MTTLWWVRHGPTHQKAFTGWRDVPADLSDTARVARLSAHLPAAAPIIASDLQRASATASAIAGARPRLPDHPGLREFDFGDWDGRHWRDVNDADPQLSRRYWEEPGDTAPPGGESWNAAAARISGAVDAVLAQHAAPHLILVAHMGAIMTQIARVGGIGPIAAMGHEIAPLSVTTLMRRADGWHLGPVNHCP